MDRRTFLAGCGALALSRPLYSAGHRSGGIVSLTYDDGLDSQLDVAVPQVDSMGLPGTFYLTWDNMKDRAAEWAALPRRGHELANHTMTHPCDLQDQRASTFAAREIDPLQHWLSKIERPSHGRDFAYPCDVTDLGPGNANQQAHRFARLLQSSGISSARTSEGPPNSAAWARHAPYRLQALALAYDTRGIGEVEAYLKSAIARGRWAILVIHEVGHGKRSQGFISPSEHKAILKMIKGLGLRCETVENAMRTFAG
jgi:peptidoglycan/xylan/chitin deacetylase (PgdA/CDA1 family)